MWGGWGVRCFGFHSGCFTSGYLKAWSSGFSVEAGCPDIIREEGREEEGCPPAARLQGPGTLGSAEAPGWKGNGCSQPQLAAVPAVCLAFGLLVRKTDALRAGLW